MDEVRASDICRAKLYVWVFHSYIRTAPRGLGWSLSFEEFVRYMKSDCAYCGIGPNNGPNDDRFGGVKYMGIDRLDSHRGYEPDNCVPCCRDCNYAKMQGGVIKLWGLSLQRVSLMKTSFTKKQVQWIENVMKSFLAR